MSSEEEVFVLLAPEVEQLLSDHDIDLVQLLCREGISVGSRFASNPADSGSGSREPLTLLLGSAAVLAVLTPTISRILDALTYDPVIVRDVYLAPVEDASGAVVRDPEGNPVLTWRTQTTALGDGPRRADPISVSVRTPIGISIDIQTGQRG